MVGEYEDKICQLTVKGLRTMECVTSPLSGILIATTLKRRGVDIFQMYGHHEALVVLGDNFSHKESFQTV
jgi:hypothetical protein